MAAANLQRVPGGWVDAALDLKAMGWEDLLTDPRSIAAYTVEGRPLAVNDAMLDTIGWRVEALFERGWVSCLHPSPDDQQRTLSIFEQLSRPGAPPRRHTRTASREDGTRVLLDLLSSPIVLPGGVRGVLTTAVDVTQRSVPIGVTRGFRELVEDAPDILSRVDVRTGGFLFVNRALERILGYTQAEIYASPSLAKERLLPDYHAALEAAIRAVIDGHPQWLVLEYRRRDEAVVTLHQALYPIRDASGHVVVIEGVARDITAVRTLERQLQQTVEELRARNAELSSLDRLKSQLLANVSHELRTPLVTIKGYNELMLRGSLGPITPRQQRALEISRNSTERLVDLIETLLDFARREEGRLSLQRVRMDARSSVREAIEHVGPRIAGKGLELAVELGEQPLEIDGDATRLTQVVKALLSNAEKFCDAPGKVTVAAALEEGRVVVRVADSGIGIPEKARKKIFDRFYQVDASATRQFGGAGLGLALAREIVTLHGGTVEVESEEGRGSTFTVRLPSVSAAVAHRSPDGERPVLLLGAAPNGHIGLRRRLEAEGLIVLEAAGGTEVIRRARRHRPDAVVLALDEDLQATMQTLHSDAETMKIPVIAVVAGERRDAMRAIADYVVSPEEAPRLADAVRRLLGHGPAGGGRRRLRVLIVDDEPEIIDFTRFVLEREGYEVATAGSGGAALELGAADGPPFDLVILDIALEGLDGIELCRRMRAEPRTAGVPILMLTAVAGDEARVGAFEAGADGLLTKPFGVDEFLRQVRLHLRSGPEFRRAG